MVALLEYQCGQVGIPPETPPGTSPGPPLGWGSPFADPGQSQALPKAAPGINSSSELIPSTRAGSQLPDRLQEQNQSRLEF